MASLKGHPEVVRLMLDNKADANLADHVHGIMMKLPRLFTRLQSACQSRSIRMHCPTLHFHP